MLCSHITMTKSSYDQRVCTFLLSCSFGNGIVISLFRLIPTGLPDTFDGPAVTAYDVW